MAMNDYSDNDYWKALAERFFEAGTSEEEERELRRFIASGLAGVAVVMTAVSLAADGGDSCVAYINGTKHTDEAIVMAQMHSTMDEMAQQAQELSVERQMDDFFVESFNN